jgi:putative transposase
MEQVVELFALACCEPEDYGRPISDWTARELAEEIVKQGIVASNHGLSQYPSVRIFSSPGS